MKSARVILGLELAAALVLRLLFAQTRSIQYDDAFTILLAERPLASIVTGTAADTMPPLFYFLLHFWGMVSREMVWLRLLPTLLNLGSLVFLYLLMRDLVGRRAALWAVGLAAISPLQIFHAQDVRMYALLAFAQIGYLWFFIRLWQFWQANQRILSWASAGLVGMGAAALYSHNLAIFGLAAPSLFLLVRREWRLLLRLTGLQLLVGLLAMPWLWMIPGQVEKIQRAFWTPRPGLIEILQTLILFNASLPLPGWQMAAAAVISLQIAVLLVLELARSKGEGAERGFLIAACLTPPVLMFVVSYVMRPIFVTRGFLISGLLYCGLCGWVIARGWPKGASILLAGLAGAAVLISLPYQMTYASFPRSPFREATAWLREHAPAGAVIVHDNKLSFFPSRVYDPALPQKFLTDEPGSHNDTLAYPTQLAMELIPEANVETAAGNADDVFYVTFAVVEAEYQTAGVAHPALAWLEGRYLEMEQVRFNDLIVRRYQKP